MPAIISVVGHSNSGKTTLVEKLVRELKSRGYSIATVKHTPQEASLDEPGKDSWRHLEAGSEATVVAAHDRLMMIKPVTGPEILDEILQLIGEEQDLLIVEGFKQSETPKIEVHRRETGPVLEDLKNRVAIATDEPLDTDVRQFSLDDPKSISDFIEEEFIRKQDDRVLSLYINGKAVPLTEFPRNIIINILLGIAASLKGVGQVGIIRAFLKKKK
jgi:molybdopterin-guanine dinucleotide biosynthesis protein MobB